VCELIVCQYNDTGNDHTGGSDIFMALCIVTILSHKQQSNSGMENSLFENISGEGENDGRTD
jgi:hypothetical protein